MTEISLGIQAISSVSSLRTGKVFGSWLPLGHLATVGMPRLIWVFAGHFAPTQFWRKDKDSSLVLLSAIPVTLDLIIEKFQRSLGILRFLIYIYIVSQGPILKMATVHPISPYSLIRVFAVRMKKAQVLSYPLSAQKRLRSASDRSGRMPTLIWVFAGRTVSFVTRWLISGMLDMFLTFCCWSRQNLMYHISHSL